MQNYSVNVNSNISIFSTVTRKSSVNKAYNLIFYGTFGIINLEISLGFFCLQKQFSASWTWTAHHCRSTALPSWVLSPLILLHRLHLWLSVQSWLEDGHLRVNLHLNNRYILQHQSKWLIHSLIIRCHRHSSHYITTAKVWLNTGQSVWSCSLICFFWRADFPQEHHRMIKPHAGRIELRMMVDLMDKV